ncbi:hypothetical protein [Kangiella sp.]|uniref:hypothetical protein n=1 Tax=Gammaproteobacteria TaxID=1236 RepID=UPI003A8F8538
MIKYLLFHIIFYLVFIGPSFKLIDVFWFLNLLSSVYFFVFHLKKQFERVKFFLIYGFVLFIYTLFVILINYENLSFEFLNETIKFFIVVSSALGIIILAKKRFPKCYVLVILRSIFFSGLFTAILALIMFFNPEIKNLLLDLTKLKLAGAGNYLSYRLIDLSQGGGVSLSLVFLLSLIIYFELSLSYHISRFYSIWPPILLLFAMVMTARTGFILGVFIFGLYLFIRLSTLHKLRVNTNFICHILFFVFLLFPSAYYLFPIIFVSLDVVVLAEWILSVFDFKSGTTGDLIAGKHYYFYSEGFVDSFFGQNDFSFPSDVAFTKMFYFGGVFAVLIYLFFWIYVFYKASFFKVYQIKTLSTSVTRVFIIFTFILFFINFKELAFTNYRSVFLALLLLYFLFIDVRLASRNDYFRMHGSLQW